MMLLLYIFPGVLASVCLLVTSNLASALPPVAIEDVIQFEEVQVQVPNFGNIDSAILEEIGIDKFFSLWNIYVKSTNFVSTDEPWTLLAPLNGGLPDDSTFVVDKEYTQEILLNHVIIGDLVQIDSAVAEGKHFFSFSDSELIFTKGQGINFVNGIRLTGDHINVDNGTIYVVEKSIPLSEPEFLQFVPFGAAPIPETKNQDVEIINKPQEKIEDVEIFETPETEKPQNVPENADAVIVDSEPIVEYFAAVPFSSSQSQSSPTPVSNSSNDSKSTTISIYSTTTTPRPSTTSTTTSSPSDKTTRPTRFDKFRNRMAQIDNIKPKILSLEMENLQPNAELTENFPDLRTIKDQNTGVDELEIITSAPFDEFAEFLIDEPVLNTNFVNSMMNTLQSPNSNGLEFIHHFNDSDLGQFLSPDKNYTAIIPTNSAFYDYYPIDWGFNPFTVENFTRDVLLNHILEGDVDLQSFDDHVEIQTIEGRTIMVSKDREGTLLVNGNVVPKETEMKIPRGRLYFIHQLLFVDYERVNSLREEYPFLETAPLLSYPWPSSPFLSHLLKRLQETQNTKFFVHLLRKSNIAHLVTSSDENLNRLSYSAFVPTDDALKQRLGIENLDSLDREVINDFLLGHIVPGYLFEEDFEDGFNLLSLTNKIIPIKMANEDILLGPSKILRPQQFVYNLGTIFMIDKPLYEISPSDQSNSTTEKLKTFEIFPTKESLAIEEEMESTLKESEDLTAQSSTLNGAEAAFIPPSTDEPEVILEVRTEISYSRQIDDGPIVTITKEEMERERRRRL